MVLALGLVSSTSANDIGLKPPKHPAGVVPLFEPEYPGLSRFFVDSTLLSMKFTRMKRQVNVDTVQKTIEIRF